MANVCNRFRSIAKDAFGRKICGSGLYFHVISNGIDGSDETKYKPYFNMFGENMGAIYIDSYRGITKIDRNHWLMVQIQNRCNSITHLSIGCSEIDLAFILSYIHKLTHLELDKVKSINQTWTTQNIPHLIYFEANCSYLENKKWIEFLSNNGQLKSLILHEIIDTVPNSIELVSLETLDIRLPYRDSCIGILNAIQCENITEIYINLHKWTNDILDLLCQYKKLESISIFSYYLSSEHLNRMVVKLPNLKKVHLKCASDYINIGKFVAQTILLSTKWENISIGLPKLPDFKHSLMFEMAEATQHNPLLKIKLFISKRHKNSNNSAIIFYWGVVRHNYGILFWNGYDHIHSKTSTGFLDLNEQCIQKILDFLSLTDLAALFNTCDSTQQAVKLFLK